MKLCNICQEIKSPDDFYTRYSYCKKCTLVKQKQYRLEHPDIVKNTFKKYYANNKEKSKERVDKWRRDNPDKFKAQRMRRAYGIEIEDWDFSRCEICGSIPETIRQLHMDHNHLTGKPRGVLCSNCNLGLGNFGDSPALLLEAINYLLKKGGNF